MLSHLQECFDPTLSDTQMFIDPLIGNYFSDITPRQRMIAGTMLGLLDDGMKQVRHKWVREFGRELPDTFARQAYTMTNLEYYEVQQLRLGILRDIKSDPETEGTYWELEDLSDHAARIKRCALAGILNYDEIQPDLTLQEPVMQVAKVQDASYRYCRHANSVDCMVGVFGMTALKHAPPQHIDTNQFQTDEAARSINRHPNAPSGAAFDLPWLMGALTTPYAEDTLNVTARVVVSVGADFGELERRVIRPIRAKDPKVDISLNVILASEKVAKANHAMAVLAADDQRIVVQDPKFKDPVELEPDKFWHDWTPTNMQAVMVVSKPKL